MLPIKECITSVPNRKLYVLQKRTSLISRVITEYYVGKSDDNIHSDTAYVPYHYSSSYMKIYQ